MRTELGCRVSGIRCRVWGIRSRVWGVGQRVLTPDPTPVTFPGTRHPIPDTFGDINGQNRFEP
jgi:hypothetical protein